MSHFWRSFPGSALRLGTPRSPCAAAAKAADTALTLLGAIGYTWEHELQLSDKRAKLDRAVRRPERAERAPRHGAVL